MHEVTDKQCLYTLCATGDSLVEEDQTKTDKLEPQSKALKSIQEDHELHSIDVQVVKEGARGKR